MGTHSRHFTLLATLTGTLLGLGNVTVADPRPTLQGLQDQINALQATVQNQAAQIGDLKTHSTIGSYLTTFAEHDLTITGYSSHEFQSPSCDAGDKAVGVSYRITGYGTTLGPPCTTVVETGPDVSQSQWTLQLFDDKEVEYNSHVCDYSHTLYVAAICLDFAPAH